MSARRRTDTVKFAMATPMLLLLSLAGAPGATAQGDTVNSSSGGAFTTAESGREAYSQIAWDQVPEAQRSAVLSGRGLVRQTWVIAPSVDPGIAGLGPTYNRPACISCHAKNGRGAPPDSSEEPMRSMLVRLSVPGKDPHGGPKPDPVYGDQLNEFGVPGVPGEGEAFLRWQTRQDRLADGSSIELRKPAIAFRKLAFGQLSPRIMTSARVAPPIYGLGLLEAVPEADILAIAAEQKRAGRGVAGTPNRVWNVASGRTVLGRFGWKANQPSVRQQIAGALAGDMGITSVLFPTTNCPAVQRACGAVPKETGPELSGQALDEMTLYHFALAVPARRNADATQTLRGEQLFATAGCADCHRPTLKTGPFPALATIGEQTVHAYTDLLLHDMGPDLADGRPDYRANSRQWRTPPLWGIGLLPTVNDTASLLHDGRARSFVEAILWHGGEAKAARNRFARMSKEERDDLQAFLGSL